MRIILGLALTVAILTSEAGAQQNLANCLDYREEAPGVNYIYNSCNISLNFRVKDQGSCKSWCAWQVGPYSKASFTTLHGHINFQACRRPMSPRSINESQYSCN